MRVTLNEDETQLVASVERLLDGEYGFDRHKGYGTAQHMQALRVHGALAVHRRSFAPVARALAAPMADPDATP